MGADQSRFTADGCNIKLSHSPWYKNSVRPELPCAVSPRRSGRHVPCSIKSATIMTIFWTNVCAVVHTSRMVCSPKRIASTRPKCDDFSRLDCLSFDRATIIFFDQELKAAKADKNGLVEM